MINLRLNLIYKVGIRLSNKFKTEVVKTTSVLNLFYSFGFSVINLFDNLSIFYLFNLCAVIIV